MNTFGNGYLIATILAIVIQGLFNSNNEFFKDLGEEPVPATAFILLSFYALIKVLTI